jgi:DnaJ like chaperone protein
LGWNGKVIGGAIGMAAMGPLGALLGVLVGHQFDTASDEVPAPGPESAARVQSLFFPALFRVMGHVAKSDGRVSEREIAAARAIMAGLRLAPEQVQSAIVYYGEGKEPAFDLDAALAELAPLLRAFPQLAQFFVEIQLQAALAGNDLAPMPRARLQRAAQRLGMGMVDFRQLETMMRWRMNAARNEAGDFGAGGFGAGGHGPGGPGSSGRAGNGPSAGSAAAEAERMRQAYLLLEVDPKASNEQVTRAWRRQLSRHHPDKLQSQGLPEAMMERAKERTQQIQAAYELIRAARGMR